MTSGWTSLPAEVREAVRTSLTEKQREAWLLWEIEELGYGTIGQKLGISTSGARNRVHAAIRNIELALERQGSSADPVREQDRSGLAAAA